jgi:hypothetical protein
LFPSAEQPILQRWAAEIVAEEITMNRQEVLDIIDHLPEQIDPEQLMTELYLKAKLDRAEAAVATEGVVSHEEVVQRSRQWFE